MYLNNLPSSFLSIQRLNAFPELSLPFSNIVSRLNPLNCLKLVSIASFFILWRGMPAQYNAEIIKPPETNNMLKLYIKSIYDIQNYSVGGQFSSPTRKYWHYFTQGVLLLK
jgi:hypothetical protein